MSHAPLISLAAPILLAILLTPMLATAQNPPSPKTLRGAAKDRMLIGTAVMTQHLDDAPLAALIAEQFNCITPENEMKPDQLQKEKGQFTFERADKLVAFARA